MIRLILFLFCWFLPLTPMIEAQPNGKHVVKEERKEEVVYTTRTGSKYHRSTCRYLSQSKIKTTKEKAIKAGNTACKVCKP